MVQIRRHVRRHIGGGSRLRAAAPIALMLAARLAFLAPMAVVSTASPASAAPPPSASAQARSLFREARRLMEKGRFAEACPKLEESLRIDPGMGTQFNLAHCWEQLGRTASAWGLFLDVAAAASSSGQRKRENAARQRAAALEPKLSRLRIDVASPAPGMKILRAGEEVGQGAWDTAVPIDPGTYSIEASAPDKRTWTGEVVVEKPGETASIEVPELEGLEPAVVEAPAPEAEAAPAPVAIEDQGSGTGRTVAMIALSAAAVGGIATGVVFGIQSKNETDAAKKLCTGGEDGATCARGLDLPGFDGGVAERDEALGHRDSAERAALISYVGLGVGAAALAGATILFFTGSGADDGEAARDAQLAPVLGPEFAGLSMSGRF
jgi:serine/threonine-protein kinase